MLLRNNGTGSVYHYYFVDIRYGITNFIEFAAETNFIRRGVRSESATYTATTLSTTDRVSVNKLTEIKGMGDILLMTTVRLPVQYTGFDVGVTGGIFLPSSKYEPSEPTNTVTNITAANSYTVNYHYNYTNGYGVPVFLISASIKMSIKKISTEADFSFKTPRNEGKNIRWEETIVDKKFSYFDKSYTCIVKRCISPNTSALPGNRMV